MCHTQPCKVLAEVWQASQQRGGGGGRQITMASGIHLCLLHSCVSQCWDAYQYRCELSHLVLLGKAKAHSVIRGHIQADIAAKNVVIQTITDAEGNLNAYTEEELLSQGSELPEAGPLRAVHPAFLGGGYMMNP